MPRRSISRLSTLVLLGSSRGFTLRIWAANGQIRPSGSGAGGGDTWVPSFSVTIGVGLLKRKLLLLVSSLPSWSSSAAGVRIIGPTEGQRPTRREPKNSFVIGWPDAAPRA